MNFFIDDIIYELFKNLSTNDAYKLSIISKAFNNAFECPKLWNHYIESIDIDTLNIIQSTCRKSTYRKFSGLNYLIKLFYLDENVRTLYQKTCLYLQYNQISIISIPSEIEPL